MTQVYSLLLLLDNVARDRSPLPTKKKYGSPKQKLSDEKVNQMLGYYALGWPARYLARAFGLTYGYCANICEGNARQRHIPNFTFRDPKVKNLRFKKAEQ